MEKIKKLKKRIKLFNLDGYIVPKNDEFFGEYVPSEKDNLKFISNFSGSFGFALILKEKNYLFVDGRYTEQAKKQSSPFFKIATIPKTMPNKILKHKNYKIGYNPKLFTKKTLQMLFNKTNCNLIPINKNLIKIYRQKISKVNKFYNLPSNAINQNYKIKINKLLKYLKRNKIEIQLITAPENVAWLLNIRGRDSEFSPITNAYLILDIDKRIFLFCNLKKIDSSLKKKFAGIKFLDIKNMESFLYNIRNKKILVDYNSCSVHFENILKKNNNLVSKIDPIYHFKAIKTKNEIKNMFRSHVLDGVALTKFLFWVKRNFNKILISELSAQEKLLQFRKQNKKFKFLSFPTISGSGPNGSIIHYKASKKSNRQLRKGDIYLVDSGGQYNFGTTDVTRTISLDNKNPRVKDLFTRVLKGHIAVANFTSKNKINGAKIDVLARKPLKQINHDYAHGTGHGVGYFLNVHEGPQAISKNNKINLIDGMVLSNEPGYYETGKFGIRIENLILTKKNKNGYFFENMTVVPIDKTLIKKEILNKNELGWVNRYHNKVFNTLKKFMTKYELIELKKACSNI